MSNPVTLIVCTECGALNRVPRRRSLSKGTCGKCSSRLGRNTPIDMSDKIFTKLQRHDQGAYVLDVWAPWCGPCNMMAPAYTSCAAKFGGDIRFLKLNSETYPKAAQSLNIRGIPALFIFDNEKLVGQKSGALPELEIEKWVKSSLEL